MRFCDKIKFLRWKIGICLWKNEEFPVCNEKLGKLGK